MITRRSVLGGLVVAALLPRLAHAERPVVLILLSDASERTTAVSDALKAGLDGVTRITYQLGGELDAAAFLADNIRDLHIDAVFALGDRAYTAAAREFTTTPVVYADVTDTTASAGRDNVFGLAARVDPAALLQRIRTLMPHVRSIGAVRGGRDQEQAWWAALQAACDASGLSLVVQRASAPADLANAMQVLLAGSDLIWLVRDADLWSPAVVARALKDASLAKKPILGFERTWLSAANPAPLVVESSAAGVGTSAAAAILGRVGLAPATSSAIFPTPWLVGSRGAFRALGINLRKETAAAVDLWLP